MTSRRGSAVVETDLAALRLSEGKTIDGFGVEVTRAVVITRAHILQAPSLVQSSRLPDLELGPALLSASSLSMAS